jgi:hypothetical protein
MTETVYPGAAWEQVSPGEAGFDPDKLETIKDWLDDQAGDRRYGVVIVRGGRLWPNLPRDSYAASGAGSQLIWVCPSLNLVVVQSPGLYQKHEENDSGLLRMVVDACE